MDPREKDSGGEAAKEGGEQRTEQESSGAGERAPADPPPAGPHGKPELTNPQSTPGAGVLPDPDEPDDALDSTSS